MITKIISGGQIGADSAGLKVAINLNIPTGGYVPRGWRTKIGPRPQLSKLGLVEHSESNYRHRTIDNIKDSDATIIFATNFSSPGTVLTISQCKKLNKPYLKVNLNDEYGVFIFDVFDFFNDNNVSVLNVAGNAGTGKSDTKFIYNSTVALLQNYIDKYNNYN